MYKLNEFVLTLTHFKNAIYNGYNCASHKKQGMGILLLDSRAIFIGTFKNDQPFGPCLIMLNHQTSFIGSFKRGLLDGPFVIRTPHTIVYSQIVRDQIEGDIVVMDMRNQSVRMWVVQKSQAVCTKEMGWQGQLDQKKVLQKISPYTQKMLKVEGFLKENFGDMLKIDEHSVNMFTVSLKSISPRVVSLTWKYQKLIRYGVVDNGYICGLGYWKSEQVEYEGQFVKSQLHGEGIKKQLGTGKIIYGTFMNGDIRTLELATHVDVMAQQVLEKLKKKVHIHSLDFINNYFNQRPIYLLRNFLESIVINEQQYHTQQYHSQSQKSMKQRPKMFKTEGNRRGLSRELSRDELVYSIDQYNLINGRMKPR